MTDDVDRGSEHEEELRSDALAVQARRAGLAGKTIDDSAFDCGVCSEPIPHDRRAALPGVQTCVDCQTELELASRTF